jgi:hypothetical protein
MLTVKRQLSRSLQVALDFQQPRETLRESLCARVSSPYWNTAFHREFGKKSAGHCGPVSDTAGFGWSNVGAWCPQVRRRLCTPYRAIIRCSTGL